MFSYPFYNRMKATTPEFEELAAFQAGGSEFSARRGESDRVAKPLRSEFVSGNYFSVFGVGAFAGRTILPSDDQPSSAPVAMLSYRTWQQQYASDPKIIGSSFILDGHPFTIIGITLRDSLARRCAAIRRRCGYRSNRSRSSVEPTLFCLTSRLAARHRTHSSRRIDQRHARSSDDRAAAMACE